MANRFWIGGTGAWSATAHWSTSTGGAGGANVPTSSDDVFIDSNSGFGGGGTITVNAQGYCKDISFNSGHSYNLTGSSWINIFGSAIFEGTITCTLELDFQGSTSRNITMNGMVVDNYVYFYNGVGGSWAFTDSLEATGNFYIDSGSVTTKALTCNKLDMIAGNLILGGNLVITDDGEFSQTSGTFDADIYNVTAYNFVFSASTGKTPTVVMGSGTWEVIGDGRGWEVLEANGEVVTIISETSTVKITGGGGSGNKTFNGGEKIYNNIWLRATVADNNFYFVIEDSNTFNEFKIDNIATAVYAKFIGGTTQTITTFTAIGTSGNLITLNSSDTVTPTQFTLSKSSGVVSCDYLDISNSNATGGATWYAGSHSADTTNNDGWIFTDEPAITSGAKPSKNQSRMNLRQL